MTRIDDYTSFVNRADGLADYRNRVSIERTQVNRSLIIARIKTAHLDYNPWQIVLADKGKYGDTSSSMAGLNQRYGWARWDEIRGRIDAVDRWLAAPVESTAANVLREVMVDIPNTIDDELNHWGKAKEAIDRTVDEFKLPIAGLLIGAAVLFVATRK